MNWVTDIAIYIYKCENIPIILNIVHWEYSFTNMHNDTFMIMVTIFKVHSHANRLWCAQIKLWRCVHPVIWRDGVSNYQTIPLKTIKISFQFSMYVKLATNVVLIMFLKCIDILLRFNYETLIRHYTTFNIDDETAYLGHWFADKEWPASHQFYARNKWIIWSQLGNGIKIQEHAPKSSI